MDRVRVCGRLCQRCANGAMDFDVAGLSNRGIRAAQAAGERTEIRDEVIKGLHVVVTPAGAATFYVRYRCAAGQRRYKIGRYGVLTIEQARTRAKKALGQVADGEDPAGGRSADRKAPTLAEVGERYMAEHVATHCKPRTVRTYRDLLNNHILPTLGSKKVGAIVRADVERMHQAIARAKPKKGQRRRGGKGVANRALALLRAVLNAAEVWGERAQHSNPCTGVRRFKEKDPHEAPRFLDAAERARLEAALAESDSVGKGHPGYVAPGAVAAIRLLAWTGARLSEITGLTWSMVDLGRGHLRLPDSKTGAKVVELAPQAVELLRGMQERRREDTQLVTPGERGGPLMNIQRAWKSIRRRAKLPGVRIHDLRHSFASDALNAGVPLALVGAMLGHRNPQTTARYAHVADEARRRAIEQTGNAIEAATHGGAKVLELRPCRRPSARA